jgi:peroxiredoxin
MPAEKKAVKIGDPAPDFTLKSLDGRELRLSDYRGKRVLLFVWASWESCREQLPVWQDFYNRHQGEGFELISVAMDALGYGVVRPFVEKAAATFPTVVDSADGLWDLYGFEILPNGYYIDERGYIRYLKVGGFDVREATTVKILDDLLSEKWPKKPVKVLERPNVSAKREIAELVKQVKAKSRGAEKRLRLAELLVRTSQYKKAAKEYDTVLAQHPKQVRALFGRGVVCQRERKPQRTLEYWRRAYALDTGNWIIRKQIWALTARTLSFMRCAGNASAFRGPTLGGCAIILTLSREQPRLAQQK